MAARGCGISVPADISCRSAHVYHGRGAPNGNTLISNQFDDQVIEIDPNGNIVFTQGQIAMPANGFNQLNAPYDAKVIGDYTGLTPPFGFEP